ncbi:tRNA (N6-threonylcarbamoyladenosine(37)-N6)-methyltransferase TrmO [Nocardia sp. NBC_00511]|uniref:tRNA (N6-threonylcarbamoyladenosine(37)-N6)-methyltransferase TrmO n=1 Tax=Nocardia sp. NBC_00511 TaxID=2903591 RepID=UPI0030E37075
MSDFLLRPIGYVESELTAGDSAPRQPDEGAPPAWVVIDERFAGALDGLASGAEILLFTWLDRADREALAVHPRGDAARAITGVFATRAPDRPNPIGLHQIHVVGISGNRIHVRNLEAFDGTPVLDIKPVLTPDR